MLSKIVEVSDNPFPGLRPFQSEESHLFFGREDLSEELLDRLSKSRFLAVVGSSGSGKSSLVRAGLLPILFGGFLDEAGSEWRVAVMRPGNNPVSELARVLNEPNVLRATINKNDLTQRIIIEKALKRSTGLVEIVRQAELVEKEENLLLVVDQFEELFRYSSDSTDAQQLEHAVVSLGAETMSPRTASKNGNELRSRETEKYENEAANFVQLLLEATQQSKVPIFVVITMRSDYFGACAQFEGLPEAINEGQYLIPRLTRDQLRKAITKPVEIFRGEITPRLVSQLLNDIGENSDQLPLLQHALMRTWKKGGTSTDGKKFLDLDHYFEIGGMAGALSKHAEAAFAYLSDERTKIAEKLFKCLTVKGPEGQEIRRPTVLKDICEIIVEEELEVIEVIEVFRRRGRSFLMPPVNEPLNAESQIDISHESLIRCWSRLSNWVDEESRSASRYQRLADTALLYKEKRAELLRGADAYFAIEWHEKAQPNKAWAKRYHTADFGIVMDFLEKSKELRNRELEVKELEQRTEFRRKLVRILKPTVAIASVLLLVLSVIAILGWRQANDQSAMAKHQSAMAEHQGYAAHMAVAQMFYSQKDFGAANAKLNWIHDHIKSDLKQNLNEFAGFEWYHLLRLSQNEEETLPQPFPVPIRSVAFVPGNDRKIVAGSDDGIVRIWDQVDGQWVQQEDLKVSPTIAITSIALSPSDRLMATASGDGKVRLCDLGTRQIQVLEQANSDVIITTVTFSPDGKRLAAGGFTRTNRTEGTLSLWQIASRSAPKSTAVTIQGRNKLSGQFAIKAIAFSPEDGRVMAIGTEEGLKLFDSVTDDKVGNLTIKERPITIPTVDKNVSVNSVAFSPIKKNLLAIGGGDSKLRLWDYSSNELIEFEVHSKEISSVTFSKKGERLATGSHDGSIKLWDTSIAGLALIKDLAKIEPDNLQLKPTLRGHAGHVKSVAFSPDGNTLVTGSNDGTAKLWDVRTRLLDISEREDIGVKLKIHQNAILSLAYSSERGSLVSGSADKELRFTSIRAVMEKRNSDRNPKNIQQAINENSVPEPAKSEVSSVTVSRSGKLLADGNWTGTLRLWTLGTGGPRTRVELPSLPQSDRQGKVLSISISSNDTTLAASLVNNQREAVRIWQLDSRSQIQSSIEAAFVAFSPTDNTLLATAGSDRYLRLWRVESGKISEIQNRSVHSKRIMCVSFSPDGKLLATGSADNTVILWNVDTLEILATFKGHSETISSLAFSSRSDRLASGSYDGTVKLWDTSPQAWRGARQPLELTTLEPLGTPLALTFSPNGRTLVAGDQNGYLWLWRADSDGSGTAQ